jgi:hypothetical protein
MASAKKIKYIEANPDICVVPEAIVLDYAAFLFRVVLKLKD